MDNPQIKLQQQYAYNVKQVLFATGMDDEELGHLMAETADSWLRRFFKGKVAHDHIMNNNAFRKWWRMHWLDRDDRFFLEQLFAAPEDSRFAYYRQLHQCVFVLLQPTTQYMYQDFLDMLPTFTYVPAAIH